jgi:hypothetical protein
MESTGQNAFGFPGIDHAFAAEADQNAAFQFDRNDLLWANPIGVIHGKTRLPEFNCHAVCYNLGTCAAGPECDCAPVPGIDEGIQSE